MINIESGHLGSGTWQIKQQDGIYFLSHKLAFSPRNEFRIGADEILDVQVMEILNQQRKVKITLSQDRQCVAKLPAEELDTLLTLVNSNDPAPEAEKSSHSLLLGFTLFFIFCVVFELLK